MRSKVCICFLFMKSDLTRTTFQDQFVYLRQKVSQSTPCHYGNNVRTNAAAECVFDEHLIPIETVSVLLGGVLIRLRVLVRSGTDADVDAVALETGVLYISPAATWHCT